MFEWLAIPAAITAAAFIPKGKMKDKDKIQLIFENTGTGIKKKKTNDKGEKETVIIPPKLYKEFKNLGYSTYLYTLPFGLSAGEVEGILPALCDGLNKKVEMEYKEGFLKMHVYETDLPESWNYAADLIRPGSWEVPIGKNHKGVLYHDFDKYCHMLVGGVTRFGKTVAMKVILNTLILNNPNDVEIYILDLKGGLEFEQFRGLPQIKAVASDIYESVEVLKEISDEIDKRMEYFKQNRYTNIVHTPIKKRTFIFIDEGAELSPSIVVKNLKEYAKYCQSVLSEIARISGALGMRLIYGTQYPTVEAINNQVKSNIVARLSFICSNGTASRVMLDQNGAEKLPAIPGRGIYLIEKKRMVQVPYITDQDMFKMFNEMEANKNALLNTKTGGGNSTNNRPPGNRKN
jgi:S-DNA-T family DNA segregation ATPase FtsK/SpoIIIE